MGRAAPPAFRQPAFGAISQATKLPDPPSLPIGGDSDTVLAIGIVPAATYGALSRYVFDVGNWDASQWVVFHAVSGQPGSPDYADRLRPWRLLETRQTFPESAHSAEQKPVPLSRISGRSCGARSLCRMAPRKASAR